MPRIPDAFLASAAYFYYSAEDADAGEPAGASGFVVETRSSTPGLHRYAVTCKHVLDLSRPVFIRMNVGDDIASSKRVEVWHVEGWETSGDGTDLAAAPLDIPPTVRVSVLHDSLFVNDDVRKKFRVGPGEEVFTVGRFIGHDGKLSNTPATWFGNIAMMPIEPIKSDDFNGLAYLVEMRSTSASSGSPVFMHVPPFALRPAGFPNVPPGPWLLGIHAGFYPLPSPIKIDGKKTLMETEAHTGMSITVPAQRLRDLLDCDVFRAQRAEKEQRMKARKSASVRLQTARPKPKSSDPNRTAKGMLDQIARRTEGRGR